MFETEDGTVSLRADGIELPASVFRKCGLAAVPRQQGAVVPNKHLSAILTLIREQQLLDTQDKLAAACTHRAREHLSERLNRALSS